MRITDPSITDAKLYLFNQGTYYHSYRLFGAHPVSGGIRFTVWCPDVQRVEVVGEFNDWNGRPMKPQGTTGVYSAVIPDAQEGQLYKYRITTRSGETFDKADPYAFSSQLRPGTASKIAFLDGYVWGDGRFRAARTRRSNPAPMNIYEVHLGSWRQKEAKESEDGSAFLTYRELADQLIPYVRDLGYTHLELMPVMEHPLDASWGYQVTGYFAPTSRYGSPKDLMYFVDQAHQNGLGVIFDWVPGHFCRDAHGLGKFNGEKLYEADDHPEWGTYKFDFSRSEVCGFLLSSAVYWLLVYHADGLRVDGVSSMLYLNFGRPDWAEKRYNESGGEEDLSAAAFLKRFNNIVHTYASTAITIAEESSAWPHVTGTAGGGLGFDFKWDMGWMNDTLDYCGKDFPDRPDAHEKLTFSMLYAFSEHFILPLSHDEVVHGKKSLLGRMPGDYWRQFAGLRLLALYQMTHPGGKLSFMSTEYGPFIEWREYESLEWFLLQYPAHEQHQHYTAALNELYKNTPALWQDDHTWAGYHWLDADDADQSILIFRRTGRQKTRAVTVLLNFQPTVYRGFRIGVPYPGTYQEIFCSDWKEFGGSGKGNYAPLPAEKIPCHGEKYSVAVEVPPIGGIILQRAPKT